MRLTATEVVVTPGLLAALRADPGHHIRLLGI
jgi:hypothetical protein